MADSVTEQLRDMAKTPFEGLQAAVLSDVSDNVDSLVSAVLEQNAKIDLFIIEQRKTNEALEKSIEDNKEAIRENKSSVKENAESISGIKIKDGKAVATITVTGSVVGGIVVALINNLLG